MSRVTGGGVLYYTCGLEMPLFQFLKVGHKTRSSFVFGEVASPQVVNAYRGRIAPNPRATLVSDNRKIVVKHCPGAIDVTAIYHNDPMRTRACGGAEKVYHAFDMFTTPLPTPITHSVTFVAHLHFLCRSLCPQNTYRTHIMLASLPAKPSEAFTSSWHGLTRAMTRC